MSKGKFIVLEGGEGAGKSTQAKLLADRLSERGIKTHLTREVGGSPLAEDIRKLWLADRDEKWDPVTELLLIYAARREHLVKTIKPKMDAGFWVICDRFNDSTVVYQGMAMGLGRERVMELYRIIAGDFMPHLTLILDVPVAAARIRMAGRQLDRYERQDDHFHEKLRQGYRQLATEMPAVRMIVDAAQDAQSVQDAIWQKIQPLLSAA